VDRRSFLRAVSVTGAAGTIAGCTPQPEKKWRIGFLRRGTAALPSEFWEAMKESGWIEGRNVEIVTRLAENRPQVIALAHDLAREKVDLVLVFGIGPTGAARSATRTIPIVFSIGDDPVEGGLVASIARPGGNLTGFAIPPYDDKLLEILKEVLARPSLVAYPSFDPNPKIERAATQLGMRVMAVRMPTVDIATDVAPFFAAARRAKADAVLVPDHPAFKSQLERFAIDATTFGLPAIGCAPLFAEAGGLVSYGPDRAGEFRTLAQIINKIFKGTSPADIPIELPAKFDLVFNLATAKALGIAIPKLLQMRATRVIQ
jgi:putative ABC transport system substrate-binding protein